MGKYYGSLESVDWTSLEAVSKIAKALGKGQSVVWNGKNYNICHTNRLAELHPNKTAAFQT